MFDNLIRSAVLGFAVGDALGVPVEFKTREYLKTNPVNDMIGYGTHNQPPGTWSDDTSMLLCTMESLAQGYDLQNIADSFVKWFSEGYWTARGNVFDIGNTTLEAIKKLMSSVSPKESGRDDENSNGNGSLMRILPLAFTLIDKPIDVQFTIIREVSAITHAHTRSVLACLYYVRIAQSIIAGKTKFKAYEEATYLIKKFIASPSSGLARQIKFMPATEIAPLSINEILITKETYNFQRIYAYHFPFFSFDAVKSTGYVLDTLESVIACIIATTSYKSAVLKAVNLGGDTDTIAALTGGLAGMLYGADTIPGEWLDKLARKDEIVDLCDKFAQSLM